MVLGDGYTDSAEGFESGREIIHVTLLDNDGNDVGWPVPMRFGDIIRGVRGQDDSELIEFIDMVQRAGPYIAPAKTSLILGTSPVTGLRTARAEAGTHAHVGERGPWVLMFFASLARWLDAHSCTKSGARISNPTFRHMAAPTWRCNAT